jgi:photosystem II stability/assembly factor-like uncharacterized protein
MSDRMFVCTRKGLFEFRRNGGWDVAATHFLGFPVSMLLADARDDSLYAALDYGHFGVKLQRSRDGGASWSEVATPSYAGVDEDSEKPPALNLICALEAGGDDRPGLLWAGTIPGGLFRSEDGGDSWELNRPLWDDPRRRQWFGGGWGEGPSVHTISVDPRDSDRVVLGVSCGGVWETRDGGESWTLGGEGLRAEYVPPDQAQDPSTQDVHRLVRCRAAPDSFWIQHHNGIFRADNGIGQWRELDPPNSRFGFAVAVHPERPGTAWFVPAIKDEYRYPADGRLLVARTTDGGATFEMISAGLPQNHAYDLIYRHGLDIDESGDRLAFGSTTGGLWFSDDGGDSWTQSEARLPPIYAVRMA